MELPAAPRRVVRAQSENRLKATASRTISHHRRAAINTTRHVYAPHATRAAYFLH